MVVGHDRDTVARSFKDARRPLDIEPDHERPTSSGDSGHVTAMLRCDGRNDEQ